MRVPAEVTQAQARSARASAQGDVRQEADRILLGQFAPPGVIVDANLEVLEFRGRTSEFLEPAPGAASLNLFTRARGDIGAYVSSAVLQARKQQSPVHVEGMHAASNTREIALEVIPLGPGGNSAQRQFLVLFLCAADVPASLRARSGKAAKPGRDAGRETERLTPQPCHQPAVDRHAVRRVPGRQRGARDIQRGIAVVERGTQYR
ncbi:MAG: hypothetical protein ACRD04_13925 [Terriglobales bacterium]